MNEARTFGISPADAVNRGRFAACAVPVLILRGGGPENHRQNRRQDSRVNYRRSLPGSRDAE